ncbi:MAG: undecaprenyldiphospho-muramoylpentapeptide beta-N-acetylglucosaminyltransferase [Polyangiaceae bacterium]|nr:undecaprenyldiphospho-muramoylpentapeptide beta-N-acetylglucosaminyltransferase [Polyangiaceae bacterium]
MTVLLAGGGTGGHVFPMLAVAEALKALSPGVRSVFVGTERGLETRVAPEKGYALELMRVLPIRGGGVVGAARGVWYATRAVTEASRLLDRLAPEVVISFGGYASGPVSLAARVMSIPLALLEPNAVLGFSNLVLAPMVGRAYTAFAEVEQFFPPARVLRTGVPLREGFEARPYRRAGGAHRVLVLGGSQGAKSLNDAVPNALARVGPETEVVHQCGPRWAEEVQARYHSLGLSSRARVVPFIDDMPSALGDADLVIARSGASAVSEICAVGRPSVLVPYPFAAGDHQRQNAQALERAGAARVVDAAEAKPKRLGSLIERLMASPMTLADMADAARRLGRPAAARVLASDVLRWAVRDPARDGRGAATDAARADSAGISSEVA